MGADTDSGTRMNVGVQHTVKARLRARVSVIVDGKTFVGFVVSARPNTERQPLLSNRYFRIRCQEVHVNY